MVANSTYRIQLSPSFRLDDVGRLVPYLAGLGVTHLYASPVMRARKGSSHGYDQVDPRVVNPELGGESALAELGEKLKRYGLKLLVDIVPNHMAACFENPFWRDVLTYGRASPYAGFFDIDWRMEEMEMRGRVLLPVLAVPLQQTLEREQLVLLWQDGRFLLQYFDHMFPVDPASIPLICGPLLPCAGPDTKAIDEVNRILLHLRELPGAAARLRKRVEINREEIEGVLSEFARLVVQTPRLQDWIAESLGAFHGQNCGLLRLRGVLKHQAYRLVHWRRAASAINYRRFFAVNELVSMRQEDPVVFDMTHAALFRLISGGVVSGVRVDHLDGLRDPLHYLQRLRSVKSDLMIYVEKILGPREVLPKEWPVSGTTGYEFLNEVERLLVSAGGFRRLESLYNTLIKRAHRFADVALDCKRMVLRREFAVPVERLSEVLQSFAERVAPTASVDKVDFRAALVELIASLPVYRTYVSPQRLELSEQEELHFREAFHTAVIERPDTGCAMELLAKVILPTEHGGRGETLGHERVCFMQRLQQLTAPAAAKGVEDTALYVHVPLLSLNEVGGAPTDVNENSMESLHEANRRRAECWPRNLLAVTTHDTKRSADVRARLDVLSEIPEEWWRVVNRWREMHRPLCCSTAGVPAPGPNAQYVFYQSAVGIWPSGGEIPSSEELADLRERLCRYLVKAVREAKSRTSWERPNRGYEDAVDAFVRGALSAGSAFVEELSAFTAMIAHQGYWNSLARTAIQYTAPGVPDLYQGDELWNFRLVDPDNRQAVDFGLREKLLGEMLDELNQKRTEDWLRELLEAPSDGRIKLYVIHRLLQLRSEHGALLDEGSYEPVPAIGPLARHVFAFIRRYGDEALLTVVPRLTMRVGSGTGRPPIGKDCWPEGNMLELPPDLAIRRWTCVFRSRSVAWSGRRLPVHLALASLPAGCLIGMG